MSKLTAMLAGAIGGLAGAALMGPAHKALGKWLDVRPPRGEDATEKVAKAVAKEMTGRKLTRAQKQLGGQIVHFAFGASAGALYGLVANQFPRVASAKGALFGTAVYVGAHALSVPALGLAPAPSENGLNQESAEFAAQVIYGVTTETVRALFRET